MMRKHSEETNWASLQSGAQYSNYASDPVNKIAISKPRSNNLKLVLQQLFCGPLSAHFCLRLSPENPLLSSLNNFWSQSCVDVLSSITASSVHCWLLVTIYSITFVGGQRSLAPGVEGEASTRGTGHVAAIQVLKVSNIFLLSVKVEKPLDHSPLEWSSRWPWTWAGWGAWRGRGCPCCRPARRGSSCWRRCPPCPRWACGAGCRSSPHTSPPWSLQ